MFFKPNTKDWFGGIRAVRLGLSKSKYGDGDKDGDHERLHEIFGEEINKVVDEQSKMLYEKLIVKIPDSLRGRLSPLLAAKIEREIENRIARFLNSQDSPDWRTSYANQFLPDRENILSGFRTDIADQLETKVPGDQRENILDVWLANLAEI